MGGSASGRAQGTIARRPSRALRTTRRGIAGAVVLSLLLAGLPPMPRLAVLPLPLPQLAAAAGEVIAQPGYMSAAVMASGQVGLLFENGSEGTRFKRFTAEQSMDPSILLSTATPAYPQIATFRGELVAGYVDTRTPNAGRFIFRISADSGATWGDEFYPFGAETFNATTSWTPVVTATRDGLTCFSSTPWAP